MIKKRNRLLVFKNYRRCHFAGDYGAENTVLIHALFRGKNGVWRLLNQRVRDLIKTRSNKIAGTGKGLFSIEPEAFERQD